MMCCWLFCGVCVGVCVNFVIVCCVCNCDFYDWLLMLLIGDCVFCVL